MPIDITDPDALFTNKVGAATAYRREDLGLDGNIPPTTDAHVITLSRRCLELGLSQLGHHEDIRQSMEQWVDAVGGTEADPGYFRQCVFSLTPSERNGRALEGDEELLAQKAETVTSWAVATFGERAVQRCQAELEREYVQRWTEAADALARRQRGQQLLDERPETVNGWELVESPGDSLAYYGMTADDGHVVVLFESDGHVRLWAFQPVEYATEVRHLDVLIANAVRQSRARRLANPESLVDGAADLKSYLVSLPSGQGRQPSLDVLDEANPQESLTSFER